jgi:hypothetical protein
MLAIFLFAIPLVPVAQLPSGGIAFYPLNNTANDVSSNGYNGTLTMTAAATNRFGTTNNATGFTAAASSGTLPLALATAMKDNFTIGFWFNTTMTAPNSAQWYNGTALVDAEACGSPYNDWGTSLVDGGKVCIGIGTPDITIKSTNSYNNGTWHFLTATRNEAAGVITLYVDGSQVATASGTATTARTSSTLIGLGKNPCAATGGFTGSLDDIIAYSRVLTSTEVTNLYNYYSSVALPLKWISFTAQSRNGGVDLKWTTADVSGNDHFEVERSTGGGSYITIGSVPDSSSVNGGASYRYTDPSPGYGAVLYRIKQVDIDGKYSWSSTVEVDVRSPAGKPYLRTNPVGAALTIVNSRQQIVRGLQVADLSGRVLVNRACNSSAILISENVGWLRPGYYLLRVWSGEATTTIGFIKL